MLTVELSMFDLMLTVAVIILVLMFVTLLLKLNPSSEKKKDLDENHFVQEEPSASQSALRFEPLPHQTGTDSPGALRTASPKVRTVDSWQSREMGTSGAKSLVEAPRIVVSADTSGSSKVEEEKKELETPRSDDSQRKPATSEPYAKPESKPFPVQGFAENDCPHKFGYLKGLPKNRPIPNECFGCSRIVDCIANKKQS